MDACHIKETTGNTNMLIQLNPGANYQMFDGFELDGNCNPATPGPGNNADCQSGIFGAAIDADHFTSGCTVGTNCPHHIWVLNNIIHDNGLSGVQLNDSEWFWILHNTLHDNSYSVQSGSYGSGISIYEPFVVSGYTATTMDNQWSPYTIIMAYNIVHDNHNCQDCGSGNSDGNGIIFDDWQHTQNTPYTPFAHYGLAFGNLAYHNGGRGVYAFYSTNLAIINNTAYNNNWDNVDTATDRGDVACINCTNAITANNIGWTFTPLTNSHNTPFVGTNTSTGDSWSNNIAFGASVDFTGGNTFPTGANKTNTNPLLVNAPSNNFALQSNSPAIGFGDADIYGPYSAPATTDAGACYHTLLTCP
jgi:parallel beta-helix repeat protein